MKPEDVLKQMVDPGREEVRRATTSRRKAEELDLDSPLQVITVASLVQAEGKTNDDFRKMAEVVYNRLEAQQHRDVPAAAVRLDLQLPEGREQHRHQSSRRSTATTTRTTRTRQKGLPPGPIGNPGDDALKAALNPTEDGWLYFVATDGVNKTRIRRRQTPNTNRLKDKFNESSGRLSAHRRAAVLGSPIAHSLSPVLHRAAYEELGLDDWSYDRFEVDEAALPGFSRGSVPSGPGSR